MESLAVRLNKNEKNELMWKCKKLYVYGKMELRDIEDVMKRNETPVHLSTLQGWHNAGKWRGEKDRARGLFSLKKLTLPESSSQRLNDLEVEREIIKATFNELATPDVKDIDKVDKIGKLSAAMEKVVKLIHKEEDRLMALYKDNDEKPIDRPSFGATLVANKVEITNNYGNDNKKDETVKVDEEVKEEKVEVVEEKESHDLNNIWNNVNGNNAFNSTAESNSESGKLHLSDSGGTGGENNSGAFEGSLVA